MKILGISCFYHDAASALIIEGELIAAAEEERFSRIKHDSGFPVESISFCLKTAGIDSKDLDYVVFYEKPFKKFERVMLNNLANSPFGYSTFYDSTLTWMKEKLWIKDVIARKLKISPHKILFSEHHLSHAASSFFTSPYKSSAILTMDGVGEWTTTAWGLGENNKIRLNREINFPHSLGLLYSTFTQFLGFEINEGEFKVMGLAPYGKPIYTDKVRKLIKQEKDGSFLLNLDYFSFYASQTKSFSKKFVKLFGVEPNKCPEQVGKPYTDIAASVQKVLEETIVNIAKNIKKETSQENLCLSGGVALNGVANWRVYKEAGFKNVYIHPAAGDSGGALGAALYLYHHILNKKRKLVWKSSYWGTQYTNREIENILKSGNIEYIKLTETKLISYIANEIKNGGVVGWFRGRFEWGPRALGARSILADPRSQKMKDLVNSKIKFREGFRPFAPVVLAEKAADFFDVKDSLQQLPLQYMLFVVPVKKVARSKLGAVTHVDGTARIQIIKREVNKSYYDLITEFGRLTGVPVLLNTSFNLKGEPVVASPTDALKTFQNSGLDILVLENCVIKKQALQNN